MDVCDWYWGSHGCDRNLSHDGHHLCGTEDDPCSEYDGSRVRHALFYGEGDGMVWDGDWSEWRDMPYGFRMKPTPMRKAE